MNLETPLKIFGRIWEVLALILHQMVDRIHTLKPSGLGVFSLLEDILLLI